MEYPLVFHLVTRFVWRNRVPLTISHLLITLQQILRCDRVDLSPHPRSDRYPDLTFGVETNNTPLKSGHIGMRHRPIGARAKRLPNRSASSVPGGLQRANHHFWHFSWGKVGKRLNWEVKKKKEEDEGSSGRRQKPTAESTFWILMALGDRRSASVHHCG